MNLPHLPPVLFAKRIVEKSDEYAKVECEFPTIPSLAMLLEAAAQASSALGKAKEGFLASASDVESFQKIQDTKVQIEVRKEFELDKMQIFFFTVEGFAQGKFTIYVK